MAQKDTEFQRLAQERAAREQMRTHVMFNIDQAIPVVCWKDEPEQCENFPEFQVYQLDGRYYYTCRGDMEELIDGLPQIPFGDDSKPSRKN